MRAHKEINTPFVFVAGAAHIDILAKAACQSTDGMLDRPGKVSIEIGGTAANIAVNLRSLGTKTKLLTALPENSAYASLVKLYLLDNGIELAVHSEPGMGNAAFSAHLDHTGEMMSAVTESPIDTVTFPEEFINAALLGANACISDCNLSSAAIRQMAVAASAIKIPFFVAGVSEAKVTRLITLKGLPITAIVINQKELLTLSACINIVSPIKIAEYFNANLIVTQAQNGLSIFTPFAETTTISAAQQLLQNNFLGSGDAIVAGIVLHHLEGINLIESAQKATHISASVISRENCSLGNHGAVEKAIFSMDEQAFRDPMTDLLNRRGGEKKLAEAETRAKKAPYHVIMIDIDHFKRVNDTCGHDIGDIVIKFVAKAISTSLRPGDFAIRWGGEEFICILNRCDHAGAITVTERIRMTIENAEIPVVGKITASLGIASWECGLTSERLVKLADEALYISKQSGRNRVTTASHQLPT